MMVAQINVTKGIRCIQLMVVRKKKCYCKLKLPYIFIIHMTTRV